MERSTYGPAAMYCRNGHRRTKSNTYIHPNGSRRCRICRSISNARYEVKRRLKKLKEIPFVERTFGRGGTHCIHGHAYTKANTYIGTHGTRVCRTCQKGYMAAYRERQAALNPDTNRKRGPVQLAFKFPERI